MGIFSKIAKGFQDIVSPVIGTIIVGGGSGIGLTIANVTNLPGMGDVLRLNQQGSGRSTGALSIYCL